MNTHMGSIHGKIISSSGSWKDNASSSSSLCAAHDKIEIFYVPSLSDGWFISKIFTTILLHLEENLIYNS